MYHYSKIKDVLTIYNQREIYHMNVIITGHIQNRTFVHM